MELFGDSISVFIYLLILICVAIHFLIEPIRWIVYLSHKDQKSFEKLCYIFFSTAFFSYVLPAKLGLPLRFWLIKKYQSISAGDTGIFMAVDSLINMIVWTGVSLLVGGEFAKSIIHDNVDKLSNRLSWQIALAVATVAILCGWVLWKKRDLLIEKFKIARNELEIWQFLTILVLFAIDICSYAVRHWLILISLSVTDLGMLTVATISILSIFAGFVSTMPMGLIGYDATIVFLLTQQGVALENAILVPVINRVSNLLVSILLGVPSAFRLGVGLEIKKLRKKVDSAYHV